MSFLCDSLVIVIIFSHKENFWSERNGVQAMTQNPIWQRLRRHWISTVCMQIAFIKYPNPITL